MEASLESCLNAAISEQDLVSDIIEACRLSNTSASDLAGWSLEDIVGASASREGFTPKPNVPQSSFLGSASFQWCPSVCICVMSNCCTGVLRVPVVAGKKGSLFSENSHCPSRFQASKLFLTEAEAEKLSNECKAVIAGDLSALGVCWGARFRAVCVFPSRHSQEGHHQQ